MTNPCDMVKDRGILMVPDFQYTELYDILTDYFSKSVNFSSRGKGFDVNKGLLVRGGVGTGKTVAFEVFRELLRGDHMKFFSMQSTRHIIREYTIEGASILSKYGRDSKTAIYFDDLGLEEVNAKMFGNTANVMGEILLDRYDTFKREGIKTYATTNLNTTQMEEVYGARLRDRMREMFNIVDVKGVSFRK